MEIKPDMHEALFNWGTALWDQALVKSGAEADALFHSAYEKFAVALRIKADMEQALWNWGLSLKDHAKTKKNWDERERLIQEGEKKISAAKALTGAGEQNN